MQQAGTVRETSRKFAVWRALLWFVAVWAVAEVPLGSGLQSAAVSSRFAMALADAGEDRPIGAVVAQAAEAGDSNGPPAGLPAADAGDEPSLAWLSDERGAARGMPAFVPGRCGQCTVAAPQSPFARGPPALG